MQNNIIEELIFLDLRFICKFYILYVSYFCLVDVRLKQDTLRLILIETTFEWKLALVQDGQLARNNNIGGVFVI